MPKRKNVFFDPKFNEWMFDQLSNLTAAQMGLLNRHELHLLKDKTSLKRFVANENLERRLSLLTKLGIEWNLSFYKTSEYFGACVNKAYKQYSIKGQMLENIADMIRQKMFVINSKEVALSLSLMSNNCHSDVYMLNPGFTAFKQTVRVTKAGKPTFASLIANNNENIKNAEIERESKNFSNILLETILLQDLIMATFNLQVLDIAILLFLYKTPRNYVSADTIKDQLKTNYKPASIGLRCAYLFRERKMIDKRPSVENVNSYIITQEGVLTVGHLTNTIINRVYS